MQAKGWTMNWCRSTCWWAVTWGFLAVSALVRANETDQFLMPNREFADLGPMINLAHYDVLRSVVAATNRRIDLAVQRGNAAALARYHSAAYLAGQVQARFGPGFFEMMALEEALRTRAAKKAASHGQLTAYRNPLWIYSFAHLPVDPRNIVLLVQSSTIRVNGVYMGVDKWGHFHDLGNIYFQEYQRLLAGGDDPQRAQHKVVKAFSRGIISESATIGSWATGVQSNGDLAANFAGFKFYLNLTQPVSFNGQQLEPLLIRVGRYWALNRHVRPDANFMAPFISDHWNEALNPGRIELGMRPMVALRLRLHAQETLDFYSRDQRPPDPAYYEQLAQELRTFRGEDYGYLPLCREDVTIANTCFAFARREESGPKMARQVAGDSR